MIEARFSDRRGAEEARRQLQLAGFREEQIEVVGGTPPLLDRLVPEAERAQGVVVRVREAADSRRVASVLERQGGTLVAGAGDAPEPKDDRTIDLVEEELAPRVVPVQVGELRIRKRVVTEVRTIEVPVTREEVVIERVPAVPDERTEAPAGDLMDPGEGQRRRAPSNLGADDELVRVPLWEERVEVAKRLVVREELVVRKRRVREVQSVEAEVRRQVPTLETEGDFALHDHSDQEPGASSS